MTPYSPPAVVYQSQPAPIATTPGIVVAGIILSFFAPFIGAILCYVWLNEARERGAGVGLAHAGIVIGLASSFILLPIMCLAS